MLTFKPGYWDDEFVLSPMDQLVGKTIARVVSVPDPESEDFVAGEPPNGWIIEFTDGSRVELTATYTDSAVSWVKPTENTDAGGERLEFLATDPHDVLSGR